MSLETINLYKKRIEFHNSEIQKLELKIANMEGLPYTRKADFNTKYADIIIEVVNDYFGIELRSKDRTAPIPLAKRIAAKIILETLNFQGEYATVGYRITVENVGKLVCLDHSSVSVGVKTYNNEKLVNKINGCHYAVIEMLLQQKIKEKCKAL